jgi:hypothetical protein
MLDIDTGTVFANAVYTELLSDDERAEFERIATNGREELLTEAKSVGLTLDDEDWEALVGYERFLNARREIQKSHLTALRKGADEPVVELPFLFSAGLALPDVETLADVIEDKVQSL